MQHIVFHLQGKVLKNLQLFYQDTPSREQRVQHSKGKNINNNSVDAEPAINNTHKTNSCLNQFIWKCVLLYTAGYLT